MQSLQKTGNNSLVLANSLDSLLEKFISGQDVNEKSKETYKKALRQFFRYLQEVKLTNITREDILAYKNLLRDKDYSAYTITCYLTAIRKFFEWTESIGSYPNIAKSIKGARQPKGFRKESLTVEQVKRVLANIDRASLQGKRDFALLNLLVRTGLRTIEVARANIEDIRQEGGEALLYIQGKGRETKDDIVLLTGDTLKPIREYLLERKGKNKEPLFASLSDRNKGRRLTTRSISRIGKQFLRNASLDSDKLSAHSFRHTAVTLSLLAGATLQEAQIMARHANINTTLIYAHNIDRVRRAPERKIDTLLAGVNTVNTINHDYLNEVRI
jgi:integrase/recombinase XerC/integrase/recombinase XerD